MKGKLLICLLLFLSSPSWGHDFYFSFAEMEYNAISQKFELTISVTTHDLERALETQGNKIENIASPTDDELEIIQAYINAHYVVSNGNETAEFSFVGHELFLKGTANFYFESAEIELDTYIEVFYDLLMESYPDQQNKLTFYYKGVTRTAAFTLLNKTQILNIKEE